MTLYQPKCRQNLRACILVIWEFAKLKSHKDSWERLKWVLNLFSASHAQHELKIKKDGQHWALRCMQDIAAGSDERQQYSQASLKCWEIEAYCS